MARGITESDVHVAADELVAAGERPTIERIRARLGTGSPNTVIRWLETWWTELGNRLQAQQARLSVPDAPEAVAALAGQLWVFAVESARNAASEVLEAERTAIRVQHDALQHDRDTFAAEAADLRERATSTLQSERLAQAQVVELQRLVNQLEGQVIDVARQRDAALAKGEEVEAARQSTELRLQELQVAARSEREQLTQHVRTVENRAHVEIDKARQEAKEIRTRLAAVTKRFASDEQSLRQETARANSAAAEAAQEASVQRARADALEQQLSKLQHLPAALEAVWRQAETKPKRETKSKRRKPVVQKSAREEQNGGKSPSGRPQAG